jgi:hypothetical protein
MATLEQAALVILARNYNPSIVSTEWLRERSVLDQPVLAFVHTPELSLVDTPKLNLVLDQNKLQLTSKSTQPEDVVDMVRCAQRFVEILPETPYHALGLNYRFVTVSSDLALSSIVTPDDDALNRLFGTGYQLGARVLFPFEGFAVKVELPVVIGQLDLLRIGFNFHADIGSSEQLRDQLSRHEVALSKARTIAEGVTR